MVCLAVCHVMKHVVCHLVLSFVVACGILGIQQLLDVRFKGNLIQGNCCGVVEGHAASNNSCKSVRRSAVSGQRSKLEYAGMRW